MWVYKDKRFDDEYSCFTWLYPLKLKSGFFNTFLQFQKFVENQHSARIKIFQSDGGAEFTSNYFKAHLSNSDIIYLLLYIDDIIITGNNSSLLDCFTCKLNSEFPTKDLGHLSYFLGLEATTTSDGLFIS